MEFVLRIWQQWRLKSEVCLTLHLNEDVGCDWKDPSQSEMTHTYLSGSLSNANVCQNLNVLQSDHLVFLTFTAKPDITGHVMVKCLPDSSVTKMKFLHWLIKDSRPHLHLTSKSSTVTSLPITAATDDAGLKVKLIRDWRDKKLLGFFLNQFS